MIQVQHGLALALETLELFINPLTASPMKLAPLWASQQLKIFAPDLPLCTTPSLPIAPISKPEINLKDAANESTTASSANSAQTPASTGCNLAFNTTRLLLATYLSIYYMIKGRCDLQIIKIEKLYSFTVYYFEK